MASLSRLVAVAHMKQDMIEQVRVALPAVAGTGLTWALQDWSIVISIAVGLATLVYILVQTAFLLRKWYVKEVQGWAHSSTDRDTE